MPLLGSMHCSCMATHACSGMPMLVQFQEEVVSQSLRPGEGSCDGEDLRGTALERALRKVDRSLDEIEENPLPLQQQLYDISRGPLGQATGKGFQAAAGLTIKVPADLRLGAEPPSNLILIPHPAFLPPF